MKRWKRLRAMRVVAQLARGKTTRFRKLVADLENEDIEDFLQQLDKEIGRKESVGLNPVIQKEYMILTEERERREKG
ncbi:MAG: hypothetical protein ACE5IJ_08810 [Thermoplasmata archaeon]